MYNNPKFHVYDVKAIDLEYLTHKSGLYFAKSKKGIIYIGKSTNLGKRLNLKLHHALKENLNVLDKIYVYEIDKSKNNKYGCDILGVFERKLINKFQPKLNNRMTQHEINRIMALANNKKIAWKVVKDDVVIDIFESGTELSNAFNSNTDIGKRYFNENRYNKLCTSHLPKLKNGEIIKGISLVKLTKNR